MQADLCLSARDILEIISSALLAEMNYQQRMNNICGNTLSPDFIPDSSTFPHIDKIISRIGTQLGLSNPEDLHGLSVGNMSEFTFQLNQGRPETLTFFTSGSTGIPVPSPTRFIDLEQEIRALADIFPERQRIISLVPRHHIYGFLFCILLPKALNIPVEFKSPLPTPKLVECMKPGDLVIAFPLLWGKLAKQNILFPEKIFAVTSTGPCPAETINGLQQKGLARMTEVYGSSETGGVGFRHDPAGFYTLLPYWKKRMTIQSTAAMQAAVLHVNMSCRILLNGRITIISNLCAEWIKQCRLAESMSTRQRLKTFSENNLR